MKIISTILFICFLHGVSAQDNKLLFHYSRYKHAIYNVGDVIAFRVEGGKEKIQRQITDITDSTIVFGGQAIAPAKISHMYVDNESRTWFPFRYKYTKLFLAAGVGYFLIDWINSGEIARSTVIVSGSLVGAAVISRLIIKDYIKLKRGRKLVILR